METTILMYLATSDYDFFEKDWTFANDKDCEDFTEFVNKHLATKEKYEGIKIVAAPATYTFWEPSSVEQVKKVINLLKQLTE